MSEYTGIIKKVFNKGKRWSLLMENDEWYGLGYKKPNCVEGQLAKFEYETNGAYKNILDGTLKAKDGPPQQSAARKPRTDYAAKEQYWADKEQRDIDTQKRISYQAAMNTAINTVDLALRNEFIVFPKTAKPKDRFEAIMAIISEQADEYFATYQELPSMADEIIARFAPEKAEAAPEGLDNKSDEEEDKDDDGW